MSEVTYIEKYASEVLESKIPVLVQASAFWCGPCRAMDPIIEDLSKDYNGKIAFMKLDVDEHADVAAQLGVRSIPTFFLIKDGVILIQKVGAQSKASMQEIIKKGL